MKDSDPTFPDAPTGRMSALLPWQSAFSTISALDVFRIHKDFSLKSAYTTLTLTLTAQNTQGQERKANFGDWTPNN